MKSCKMRKSRNSNQSCPRTRLTNSCSPTHKVRAGLHKHTLLTRGPKPSTPKGETLHCKQVSLVLYMPFQEMSSPIRRQLIHSKKTFWGGKIPSSLVIHRVLAHFQVTPYHTPPTHSVCSHFWIRARLGERTLSKQQLHTSEPPSTFCKRGGTPRPALGKTEPFSPFA